MHDILSKLLTLIRGEVLIIQQLFKRQLDDNRSLQNEISSLVKEVRNRKPPVVNVPAPKVEVKVPDVIVPKIEVPEVKIPPIHVPEVKVTIPPITVPKPEVMVNVPPIKLPKPEKPTVHVHPPKVEVKAPKQMTVEGFKEFARQIIDLLSAEESHQYDRENPMPVVLIHEGREYRAGGGSTVISGGSSGSEDPLEKYKIADMDDASNPKYYGFTDRDGHWYILEEDSTAKTYRYAAGSDEYSSSWNDRASLTYDYFHNVF